MSKDILNKKTIIPGHTSVYINMEVYRKFAENVKKFNLSSSETISQFCSRLNEICEKGSGEICFSVDGEKFYAENKFGGKIKE